MKIISEGKECFMVQVSRNEMANLLGYYYSGVDGYVAPKEGQEVQVSAMYQHLYTHKDLLSRLKKSAKELREYANAIEKVPVPIKDSL
jgi:hypothetical protein